MDITLERMREARERIRDAIYPTPCHPVRSLSEALGRKVFLKLENLQLAGAFKIRGNLNRIALMSLEERTRGVIAASSGNHGLGMSLAAAEFGVAATVVAPESAPAIKVQRIQAAGGRVILHGRDYAEAMDKAHAVAAEEGQIYISSFDDPDIVAGNGSIGLEILEAVPEPEVILCPIGGGGGIAGVALATKLSGVDCRIMGVQAERMPSMVRSLEAGCPTPVDPADTVADGIAIRCPGALNLDIAREYVDDVVTVSEEAILNAVAHLAREAKVVAECAGAATTAAVLEGLVPPGSGPVVCMVSGGNIDLDFLSTILTRTT